MIETFFCEKIHYICFLKLKNSKIKSMKIKLLVAFFASFSLLGQTNLENALSKMQLEIATSESAIAEIEVRIEKDNHKEIESQIHILKASLSIIGDLTPYIKENKTGMLKKLEASNASTSTLEGMVHNSRFLDKDKSLDRAFETLKRDITSLKNYIQFLEDDNNEQKEIEKKKTETSTNSNSHESTPAEKSRTAVTTLRLGSSKIQNEIHTIEVAMKKGNYHRIHEAAEQVISYCNEMIQICNTLEYSKKNIMKAAIEPLIESSTSLNRNAKIGKTKHHEVHHELDKVKKDSAKLESSVEGL